MLKAKIYDVAIDKTIRQQLFYLRRVGMNDYWLETANKTGK